MAVEPKGDQGESQPRSLTRRMKGDVRTVFDPNAGAGRRIAAGGELAVAAAAPAVGVTTAVEVANRVDPGLLGQILGPTMGETAWITATAAGGTALVASVIGAIAVSDAYTWRTEAAYRGRMIRGFDRLSVPCLLVAGAAGLTAVGLGAGDVLAGLPLATAGHVVGDVAVAAGITGVIGRIGQKGWQAYDRHVS